MSSTTLVHAIEPEDPDCRGRLRVEFCGGPPALRLSFRDLAVSAQDVTTVQAALESCSPDDLLAAVLRHEAGWRLRADALASRTYGMLIRKVTDALDDMVACAAESIGGREAVVGPFWQFAAARDGTSLEYAMGAAVCDASAAPAARALLETGAERARTWDELRANRDLPFEDADLRAAGCGAFKASVAQLANLPWSESLAMPLWLPGGLSERERYALLAKVFWTMTYQGFTREERQRRAAREPPAGRPASAHGGVREFTAEPWPSDPVHALLNHNCWIDALEMWSALFAVRPSSETCL